MGMFSMMREARQATELENEVIRRVQQLDDPSAVTIDNLELQLLVMRSDVKRYSRGKFYAKDMWGNAIDWQVTIRGTEGFINVYERAIDEGLDQWLDDDFLEEEYDRVKELRDQQDDKYEWAYYSNQMKAIAGLQEGELYHCWTDPTMVIGMNPAFIRILEKRGLLYDAFDPSRAAKKKPADKDEYNEYDDDIL